MRASVAKKLRRTAKQEAHRALAASCVVERRWYMNRIVFTAFAWPVTNLIVVPLNALGWHSLGRRWVEWCKRLSLNGNRIVVKQRAA